MPDYLVTYDLRKPGRNYQPLYDAIKSVPNCHGLESVWFIQHDGNAEVILDWLKQHIDSNDILFVTAVGDWASYNMNECGKWLNE